MDKVRDWRLSPHRHRSCTATRHASCSLSSAEHHAGLLHDDTTIQAMLPDGRDAGLRIDRNKRRSLFGSKSEDAKKEVVVAGRRLECFQHVPTDGVRVKVCRERSKDLGNSSDQTNDCETADNDERSVRIEKGVPKAVIQHRVQPGFSTKPLFDRP